MDLLIPIVLSMTHVWTQVWSIRKPLLSIQGFTNQPTDYGIHVTRFGSFMPSQSPSFLTANIA